MHQTNTNNSYSYQSTFTTGQPSAQLPETGVSTSNSDQRASTQLVERSTFTSGHRHRASVGVTGTTFGGSSSSLPSSSFSHLAYEAHAERQHSMGAPVETYGVFVTGRSRLREDKRRGVVPTVTLRDGEDDIYMSRLSDWQAYRESDDMSDDEDDNNNSNSNNVNNAHAMDVDDDDEGSIEELPNQEPSGAEPMDVRVNGEMEENDPVDDLMEQLENLRIKGCFMEEFFGNTVVDEQGRTVRRSPRLQALKGSFQAASGDGRYLVRRSRRIASMSASVA